jgi:hypothetical protein
MCLDTAIIIHKLPVYVFERTTSSIRVVVVIVGLLM